MGRKFIFDNFSINDAIGVGAVVVIEPFLNQLIHPLTSKINVGAINIQVDDIVKVILGGYMAKKGKESIIGSSGKALLIIALARIFSGLYNKINLTTTTTTATSISATSAISTN